MVSAWSREHEATRGALSVGVSGSYGTAQGVKPAKPVSPRSGQWGALELGVRYHAFGAESSIFPVFADPAVSVREAHVWDVSANWYWNAFVKFMANYEQATYAGGAAGGNRRPAHPIFVRMQFSL